MKALFLSLFLGATTLVSAQVATQEITLQEGWNAVWLEVEPFHESGPDEGQLKSPDEVFNDSAVLIIATPKPLAGIAEFFGADPGAINTFNQDEWQQWKKVDPSGSNNLPFISGNRPYLIQVQGGSPDIVKSLSGRVRFFRPTWTPDRYNLLGFGLAGTPTFGEFFGPSGTKHSVEKIFRLNALGSWETVAESDEMAPSEAYWIFANGPSTYMGPVAIDFSLARRGELSFGSASDAVSVSSGGASSELDLKGLVFSNLGSGGVTPELALESESGSAGDLSLRIVKPTASGLSFEEAGMLDGTTSALGKTIAGQGTSTVTLGAQRQWADPALGRVNLYRLSTGAGSAFWLPVSAELSSLTASVGPGSPVSGGPAGLWVGEVKVSGVSSIVDGDSEIPPAAGAVPMRIILHCDAEGAVQLLSHVTLMQTRTADPDLQPDPVLVVDAAKIPFFEGIKERGGKKVGVRIATVGYDMPRSYAIESQSEGGNDLIDLIVAESGFAGSSWLDGAGLYPDRNSVTDAAIQSFLLSRATRPPSLKEVYRKSLPLQGSLGAGSVVSTEAGSLRLDSFHRSNPFRHAFHQSQARGPLVVREMEITFDSSQAITDRLLGTTRETLSGLTKEDLVVTGTVELRRISTVPVLDTAP